MSVTRSLAWACVVGLQVLSPASVSPQIIRPTGSVDAAEHRIGTVDVPRILREYQAHIQAKRDYNVGMKRLMDEIQEGRQELERLQIAFGKLPQQHEIRAKAEQEILRVKSELDVIAATGSERSKQLENELLSPVLLNVLNAIEAVAKERGYTLVLRHVRRPEGDYNTYDVRPTLQNKLSFYNPEVDITESVIRLLHRNPDNLCGSCLERESGLRQIPAFESS